MLPTLLQDIQRVRQRVAKWDVHVQMAQLLVERHVARLVVCIRVVAYLQQLRIAVSAPGAQPCQ